MQIFTKAESQLALVIHSVGLFKVTDLRMSFYIKLKVFSLQRLFVLLAGVCGADGYGAV